MQDGRDCSIDVMATRPSGGGRPVEMEWEAIAGPRGIRVATDAYGDLIGYVIDNHVGHCESRPPSPACTSAESGGSCVVQ